MSVDYLLYYDTERYLFGTVTQRFQRDGYLSAVDFFTIVRWKANRAISRVSTRLLQHEPRTNLASAVEVLTRAVHEASTTKDRLRILIEGWKFHLPMASAILTVCYPDDFGVYDVRVREALGESKALSETRFDEMWSGYQKYLEGVRQKAPVNLSLRDEDRWLWGKSAYDDLENAIARSFLKNAQDGEPATRI